MKRIQLVCIILLCFSARITIAQETKTIKLKQQKISYSPANCYVSSIVDERTDTNNIGSYHTRISNKEVYLAVENGLAGAIKNYLDKNMQQDQSLPEVSLHIIRLNISEKKVGLATQTDLNCSLAFYANGSKLIEYTGSSYMQSVTDPSAYIETMLRQNIEKSIKDFDKWLDNNKNSVVADAPVEVTVKIGNTIDDPEQIAYTKSNKLTSDDFQGTPDDLNTGTAATYSGIDLKYSTETRNYNIKITVILTPYFDKTKSWKRTQTLSEGVLGHEQRHFDITSYKTCELADSITHHVFTKDNFAKELKDMLRKADKEISALQNKYDTETNHGTVTQKQKEWDIDIRNKINSVSCY